MLALNHEVPSPRMIQFLSEVDLRSVEQFRTACEQRGEIKPSFTTFVVKAFSIAVREYPYVNRRMFSWGPIDATFKWERV